MKKILDDSTDMGRLLLAAKAKYPHIKNYADIARHIEVAEAVLTNWKKRGIPAAKIFDLAETFSCNPKWLATKKGHQIYLSHTKPASAGFLLPKKAAVDFFTMPHKNIS